MTAETPSPSPLPNSPNSPSPQATHPTAEHSCCSHESPSTGEGSALPVVAEPCDPAAPCPSSESSVTTDESALIEALREVIDPELMINIVDLGLVYAINQTDRKVLVEMTLTSPACPAGPQIITQAKMSLERLKDVDVAEIKLTMSPPWTPARMTDEARDQLGIF